MPVFLTLDYTGWFAKIAAARGGKGFTRAGKRFLLREANRKAVEVWHRKFIKRHFEANARSRYHYQQRKKRYRGIKQDLAVGQEVFVRGKKLEPEVIQKQGRVDIVRSGETEAKAEAPSPIRATASGATTKVTVPRYVLKKRGGQPDQKVEIQKLTRQERGRLMQVHRGQFFRDVRRFGKGFRMKRRLGTRSGRI